MIGQRTVMPYASGKTAVFAATLLATFTFAVQRASSATTIFADLTGDGIAETITGQPTGIGTTVNSGRVIVYDGVTGAALLFIAGESSGDEFGASVALLHDPNHDVVCGEWFAYHESGEATTPAGFCNHHCKCGSGGTSPAACAACVSSCMAVVPTCVTPGVLP
jgi:hypothetical protein